MILSFGDKTKGHLPPTHGVRDTIRQGVELAYSLGKGKDYQEKRFMREKTLFYCSQGLIRGIRQALEDQRHVPGQGAQVNWGERLPEATKEHREFS